MEIATPSPRKVDTIGFIYLCVISLILCSQAVVLMLLGVVDGISLVSFVPAAVFFITTGVLITMCLAGLSVKGFPAYIKVTWLFSLPVMSLSLLVVSSRL